jgi:hypothetical protein
VAELLRLGAGELRDAGLREPLAGGVADRRRIDQEALGQLEVAVVLQHAGIGDPRLAHAVELVEVRFLEGARDLDRAVAAEVEEHHRVAVLDRADRLAVGGDDEGRQVLVDGAGMLFAQRVDGGRAIGILVALAQHMHAPAFFHQGPVGLVAVHGDVLAAAARGDAGVEAAALTGEEGLEGFDVVERAGFRHVAAVEQDVMRTARTPSSFARATIALRWSMWLCTLPSENRPSSGSRRGRRFAAFAGDDLLPGLPCQIEPEAMASATSEAPWL